MAIREREANRTEQRHRAGCKHWRRAGDDFREERKTGCRRLSFELELLIALIVQADADWAAQEEGHHQTLQTSQANGRWSDNDSYTDRDAGTQQDERHELRRRFIVAEEQQLGERSSAAQHQRPQEHGAKGGQCCRFGNRRHPDLITRQ